MESERQGSQQPTVLPWQDRPDPGPGQGTHRSSRDADILRALAQRIPSGDAAAHNNLGVVYFQKGLLTESVAQFERALQIDPILEVAERNLQIAYFSGDFYDASVRSLHATLARNPSDTSARRRLARMYLWGGDAAAALRELHQLRTAFPRDPGLWHEVARAEERTGDLDAALQALAEADRVAPGNAKTGLRMAAVIGMLFTITAFAGYASATAPWMMYVAMAVLRFRRRAIQRRDPHRLDHGRTRARRARHLR